MNKERREKIKIGIKLFEKAKDTLQEVLDDEQFAFDNMPENLQGSMRGMESEEAIEKLENSIDKIAEVIDELDEI
jgi:hypothetical protein